MSIKDKQEIIGKWNKNRYTVEKVLGRGANGQVYLVKRNYKRYALKLSKNTVDLMPEIKILKHLQQAQGPKLGPFLHDVDDTSFCHSHWASFYVMDWIEGRSLNQFLNENKKFSFTQTLEIMISLLTVLHKIHLRGFCFGDLKPANIILDQQTKRPFLVDFGGVTPFGFSVRQFTEEYDRGFWQAGLRKSEEAYDLFSIGMVMVELLLGKKLWSKLSHGRNSMPILYDIIRRHKQLKPLYPVLKKIFNNKYSSAEELKDDLMYLKRNKTVIYEQKWISIMFTISSILFITSIFLYF